MSPVAARLRPYALLVACVAVVVFLPATDDDNDEDAGRRGRAAVSAEAGSGAGAGGAAAASGELTAGGPAAPPTGRDAGARSTGSAPGARPGPSVSVGGQTYPGMGTPAALANPRCDAGKGRIRFPTSHAPPCVAPWPEGADNGGGTARGVAADKIRVLVISDRDSDPDLWPKAFNIFNKQFELWGRQFDPVLVQMSGEDEVAQRADATRFYNDHKPFVVTGRVNAGGPVFATEMAARGVIHTQLSVPWKVTQTQAPYRWGVLDDDRYIISHAVEYIGKRLVGRPAKWAGDTAYTARPRTFGLIYPETWDQEYFEKEGARYGLKLATKVSYPGGFSVFFQEQARTAIARFKEAGATSVIVGSDVISNVFLTREATNQLYFPEWILTGIAAQDAIIISRANDQQQWQHAFGVGTFFPFADSQESDGNEIYEWQYGEPTSGTDFGQPFYLAEAIATCVHMAGPNLTAQTYRDGCFAYPPTGGAVCNCVSSWAYALGPTPWLPWPKYSFSSDMAEKWWDPTVTGPDEAGVTAPGMYRYVDGGKRYLPGQWPTSEPRPFDTNGTVTRYQEYPPQDRLPDYENERPG